MSADFDTHFSYFQVTPSRIEARTSAISPVRQLLKVARWKDLAAGYLSSGLT